MLVDIFAGTLQNLERHSIESGGHVWTNAKRRASRKMGKSCVAR
jgi:hypothetical protein